MSDRSFCSSLYSRNWPLKTQATKAKLTLCGFCWMHLQTFAMLTCPHNHNHFGDKLMQLSHESLQQRSCLTSFSRGLRMYRAEIAQTVAPVRAPTGQRPHFLHLVPQPPLSKCVQNPVRLWCNKKRDWTRNPDLRSHPPRASYQLCDFRRVTCSHEVYVPSCEMRVSTLYA